MLLTILPESGSANDIQTNKKVNGICFHMALPCLDWVYNGGCKKVHNKLIFKSSTCAAFNIWFRKVRFSIDFEIRPAQIFQFYSWWEFQGDLKHWVQECETALISQCCTPSALIRVMVIVIFRFRVSRKNFITTRRNTDRTPCVTQSGQITQLVCFGQAKGGFSFRGNIIQFSKEILFCSGNIVQLPRKYCSVSKEILFSSGNCSVQLILLDLAGWECARTDDTSCSCPTFQIYLSNLQNVFV